jgi:hypothetical protein
MPGSKFKVRAPYVARTVRKYILSLFVKRKREVWKEGPQMAITCNEERRHRWTDQLKGRKEKLTDKKRKKVIYL